jgi:hypothetical protein
MKIMSAWGFNGGGNGLCRSGGLLGRIHALGSPAKVPRPLGLLCLQPFLYTCEDGLLVAMDPCPELSLSTLNTVVFLKGIMEDVSAMGYDALVFKAHILSVVFRSTVSMDDLDLKPAARNGDDEDPEYLLELMLMDDEDIDGLHPDPEHTIFPAVVRYCPARLVPC